MEKKTKGARIYDIGTGRMVKPEAVSAESSSSVTSDNASPRNHVISFFCSAFFYILMWLRPFVRFFLGLVGLPAAIAAPIVALGLDTPNKTSIVAGLIALSFGAFMLRWLYDSLLFRLSPEPVFLNS